MVYNICIKALNFGQVIISKRQCIYNLYVIHHYNCISKVIMYHKLNLPWTPFGNSTLKSKYKSVLNVRERGYCNRSRTLQGCTILPTLGQDQRPYPWPRISVDSCLNLHTNTTDYERTVGKDKCTGAADHTPSRLAPNPIKVRCDSC